MKSAAKPLQAPQGYSSAPYLGSGAPSSMYMGVPLYGSSLFNGSSIPPYDVPFTGGSAYHYNYGSCLSSGTPYRPLHISGPPPYSGGSMMGNGGMYAMPPLMDWYGLGMPMGPAAMGPRPGFFPDDISQKKGSEASRDNDWTCLKCGNINFSFRTVCNMRKCNTSKPGSQFAKSDKNSKQKMPEGSWKCEKCNNINYPFWTKCNRQNCGAEKPAESKKSPSLAPDEDDQVDPGPGGWTGPSLLKDRPVQLLGKIRLTWRVDPVDLAMIQCFIFFFSNLVSVLRTPFLFLHLLYNELLLARKRKKGEGSWRLVEGERAES
ncbi:PREDICTED: ranBP2-type zinc finger protein At1g67325-like isoform X2 [Populus euphratica]|uniref:RanBP2-type zinc finger protein At1g67325-like isoform X2 n=1 Tax=Populus euphratica TaxID=75702 RepID=A0AAJ6X2N4_POPEU|nr:PREDICTED: ranBP2-type zinc finger protein At1g67325-like isoform X2 [Populus euphratica]